MGKLPTSVGTAVGVTDGMTVGAIVAVGVIVDLAVGTTAGCAVGIGSAVGAQAVTTSNPTATNEWNKRVVNILITFNFIRKFFLPAPHQDPLVWGY
jgi:hypothetical protein